MPEIRASSVGAEYDPDRDDPVLVVRDEYGVLRPVTSMLKSRDFVVRGNLRGYREVLILETER